MDATEDAPSKSGGSLLLRKGLTRRNSLQADRNRSVSGKKHLSASSLKADEAKNAENKRHSAQDLSKSSQSTGSLMPPPRAPLGSLHSLFSPDGAITVKCGPCCCRCSKAHLAAQPALPSRERGPVREVKARPALSFRGSKGNGDQFRVARLSQVARPLCRRRVHGVARDTHRRACLRAHSRLSTPTRLSGISYVSHRLNAHFLIALRDLGVVRVPVRWQGLGAAVQPARGGRVAGERLVRVAGFRRDRVADLGEKFFHRRLVAHARASGKVFRLGVAAERTESNAGPVRENHRCSCQTKCRQCRS